jgi:hypothetical protein
MSGVTGEHFMPFVKLDTRILQSTLWFERDARELFITALLMAEPRELQEVTPQLKVDSLDHTGFNVPPGWYGFIPAAGIGIIRQAAMERGPGMKALAVLGEPDIESRSKDFEGRRLVRVDGGFVVLNFIKFRDRDTTTADRSRRYRWKKRTQKERETPQCDTVTSHRDITAYDTSQRSEVRDQSPEIRDQRSDSKDLYSVSSVISGTSATPMQDDAELRNPTDLDQVLKAFQESVVTKNRVSKADQTLAAQWLVKKNVVGGWTASEIENGIVLATARKINSDLQNGAAVRVKSLAYFEEAIAEAASDETMTDGYLEHQKRFIRRRTREWEALKG